MIILMLEYQRGRNSHEAPTESATSIVSSIAGENGLKGQECGYFDRWGETQGYVRYIHTKTGIRTGFIVVTLLVVALCMLIQGITGGIALFFVGVILPAYQSFKAIESPNKADDTKLLNYWCVFIVIATVDRILEPVLWIIPLFGLVKFGVLLALTLNDYWGSVAVYQWFLAPALKSYQAKIDLIYTNIGRLYNRSGKVTTTSTVPVSDQQH